MKKMKYYNFWADYTENVLLNNELTTIQTEVDGYISDAAFSPEIEMEECLENYYNPSVVFTDISLQELEYFLTTDEIAILSLEKNGRTSLYEWVKETHPDGYVNQYMSGRQPKVQDYIDAL
jgi:hypothetical protein